MPKITDAHRESRRDQILDAALACFAERGFQATSMADIIAASGLSAGAIYLYFAGKRDIALAVARRTMATRAGELAARAQAGDALSPSAMIRTVSAGLERDGIGTGLILQLWGEAATDPTFFDIVGEALAALGDQFVGALANWATQARGMDAADAHAWATEVLPVMLALGQGYMVQRTLMPDFDLERYLAGVERVLG